MAIPYQGCLKYYSNASRYIPLVINFILYFNTFHHCQQTKSQKEPLPT